MITPELRLKLAAAILPFEARRDPKTKMIKVFPLKKSDGGGITCPGYPNGYEVGGCNNRYHPKMAAELRILIEQGKPLEAEDRVIHYIADYTDAADMWTSSPGVNFFLRDCIWNRGATGAVAILQESLNHAGADLKVDGRFGLLTAAAYRKVLGAGFHELLAALRWGREHYEQSKYPWKKSARKPGDEFYPGLVNRWNGAHAKALEFGL